LVDYEPEKSCLDFGSDGEHNLDIIPSSVPTNCDTATASWDLRRMGSLLTSAAVLVQRSVQY